MDKLGLGYEKLRSIKPDIIMIQMSGYGQTGPFKGFVGYGPPASAASGMFYGTGYPGGEPMEIGISYPDPNAGIFGAFAIMAALTHRALTGEGQYIDQSQWETALGPDARRDARIRIQSARAGTQGQSRHPDGAAQLL